MRNISEATDLVGKRVLVRASLNVPMTDGAILDTSRIEDALATIHFLRNAGACTILISHLSGTGEGSIKPVYEQLKEYVPVSFVGDILSPGARATIQAMKEGDVVLAENIRMHPEEEENDQAFAQKLADLADIYVNDDFTVSHRTHASIVSVPKLLPSYAGLSFQKEYSFLSQALNAPAPSLAIIGGSKPETKIPLIVAMLEKMTDVYICGVAANALWQSRGYNIGTSMSAEEDIPEIAAINAAENAHLPSDVRIVGEDGEHKVVTPDKVPGRSAIVDAGPRTLGDLDAAIKKATFVLWNGPLGEYEKGFTEATHALAHLLAESHKRVIVGGGDTVAAIKHLNLPAKFTYLSTSGGAMIDFLADGNLPGIDALQ